MYKHPFLNEEYVANRLIGEWKKYKKIVIAVDFDNTLFDYHNTGDDYSEIVDLLKKAKRIGCYIIIFTANDGQDYHKKIREYCRSLGIEIDTINENVNAVPFKTMKPYYNILLDDRAGLHSAYSTLKGVIDYFETQGIDRKLVGDNTGGSNGKL